MLDMSIIVDCGSTNRTHGSLLKTIDHCMVRYPQSSSGRMIIQSQYLKGHSILKPKTFNECSEEFQKFYFQRKTKQHKRTEDLIAFFH